MTPEAADVLRRAAAHLLVDDVSAPALTDDAAHHVFRVLRIADGDVVTVTDGAGSWRECRAVAGVLEPDGDIGVVPRRSPQHEIAFAIPKQDRPEWIVQKLTELGVDRIRLLHAERSIVRWTSERAERHLAKLRRVASEAVQQSRGVWLPDVGGPLAAAEVLPRAAVAEPGAAVPAASWRTVVDGAITIAIGPEGGWSESELAAALGTVRLGPTVLRVETAAIVAGVAVSATTS